MSRSTSYPAWCRGEEPVFMKMPVIPESIFETQREINRIHNQWFDELYLSMIGIRCEHSFTLYTVARGWYCKYCKVSQ